MTSAHRTAFNQATIGFAHEKIRRNKPRFTAFQVALRDAWLTLREDPVMLQSIVTDMLSDEGYTKFVGRASGLYYFEKAA